MPCYHMMVFHLFLGSGSRGVRWSQLTRGIWVWKFPGCASSAASPEVPPHAIHWSNLTGISAFTGLQFSIRWVAFIGNSPQQMALRSLPRGQHGIRGADNLTCTRGDKCHTCPQKQGFIITNSLGARKTCPQDTLNLGCVIL